MAARPGPHIRRPIPLLHREGDLGIIDGPVERVFLRARFGQGRIILGGRSSGSRGSVSRGSSSGSRSGGGGSVRKK